MPGVPNISQRKMFVREKHLFPLKSRGTHGHGLSLYNDTATNNNKACQRGNFGAFAMDEENINEESHIMSGMLSILNKFAFIFFDSAFIA